MVVRGGLGAAPHGAGFDLGSNGRDVSGVFFGVDEDDSGVGEDQ